MRLMLVLLAVLLFGAGGCFVYAKYLKASVRRGIAVASSIWLRSNYAYPVTEGMDTTDMSAVMKTQAASTDETGTNYNFVVEVQNYQNILLFNGKGENVPYEISFWLSGDANPGDGYEVTPVYKDRDAAGVIVEKTGTTTPITGKSAASAVHFTHEKGSPDTDSAGLPGGEALEDEYRIQVTAPGGSPVSLYVLVKTTEEAVLTETLKGEIVFVKGVDSGEYLRSAGFSVNAQETDDAAWVAAIKKQSMLNYKIVTGSADADTEEITLYWDPKIYQIDRFANSYVLWEEDHQAEAGEAQWAKPHTAPGELAADSIAIAPGEENWHEGWSDKTQYITLRADSYAAISVGFFRGENFSEASFDTRDTYHKYVHAEPGTVTGG